VLSRLIGNDTSAKENHCDIFAIIKTGHSQIQKGPLPSLTIKTGQYPSHPLGLPWPHSSGGRVASTNVRSDLPVASGDTSKQSVELYQAWMRSSEAGWFMRIQHYQSEATTSMAARTTAFRR
jgi:hypothetical protein